MLKRLDGRLIPDTLARAHVATTRPCASTSTATTQVSERVLPALRDLRRQPTAARGGSEPDRCAPAPDDPMVARARRRRLLPGRVAQPHHAAGAGARAQRRWRRAKGRKSLILVSEGFIYDPNLDEFKHVTQASRRANVAIYFLDTRGPGGHARLHDGASSGPPSTPQDIGAAFAETLRGGRRARSRWPPTAAASPSRTPTTSAGASSASPTRRAATTCSATPRRTPRATAASARSRSSWRAARACEVRARKGYFAPLRRRQDGLRAEEAGARSRDPGRARLAVRGETAIPLRMTSYVVRRDARWARRARWWRPTSTSATSRFEEKEGRFLDTLRVPAGGRPPRERRVLPLRPEGRR